MGRCAPEFAAHVHLDQDNVMVDATRDAASRVANYSYAYFVDPEPPLE